jgi:predicted aspartyl protease
MSTQIGYLDENGHPRITIHIRGTHPTEFVEVDALVDTGFAGFLMLPIAQALPLGLALYGTGDYTLADGSPISCFLADGAIEIRPPSRSSNVNVDSPIPFDTTPVMQPETVTGVVVLGGEDPLVGMEFFKGLKKWLVVGSIVLLLDEASIPVTVTTPKTSE